MQRPILLLLIGSSAFAAQGGIITTVVHLDGFQPVPPTGSTATGIATVTVDTDTRDISVQGSFSGLTSAVSAGHIHGPADAGQSSQVVILPLVLERDDDFLSGTFTVDARLSRGQFESYLESRTYINLHTASFPAGEIRGQIVVPSPGGLGVLALGGLIGLRRRR